MLTLGWNPRVGDRAHYVMGWGALGYPRGVDLGTNARGMGYFCLFA